MKNKKRLGIFGKVFLYTLLFLILVIGVIAVFFARQFMTAYDAGRKQQLMDIIQPLCNELEGKTREDILAISKTFHEKNTSVKFYIQEANGAILFETVPTIQSVEAEQKNQLPPAGKGDVTFNSFAYIFPLSDDMTLYVFYTSDTSFLTEIITRTMLVLVILLVTTVLAAVIFARGISNPIKKLADDTEKMSNLEFVPAPALRRDEIGQLTKNVHKMYENLKSTISRLEDEIEREREMEENQRYFFSAASHELKTPITAASAMLEGMIDNVVKPSEHPEYLAECLKMMTTQSKLISEILEIVRLRDGKIQADPQPIELLSTVNSILPAYQTLADTKEQKINVSIHEEIICRVDNTTFRRVVSNVIMNAIQNSPDKGEIRIWGEEQNSEVIRLCVLNTSAYIDEEIVPKLFEPFYRIDKIRNISETRSGLGLTIVKRALDYMGITFSLENTKEGVLFWMDLLM